MNNPTRVMRTMLLCRKLLAGVLLPWSLVACSGAAIVSAGISGTGITTGQVVVGVITGFGSIYVNNVKYDIDQAELNLDGDSLALESQLRIGMIVKLTVQDNGDGTGIASTVAYDDSIEGPVNEIVALHTDRKRLSILGNQVYVNRLSTSFQDGASFDGMTLDQVVEISGFINPDDSIEATLVSLRQATSVNSRVELHGVVSNLFVDQSFTLNQVTVYFDSTVNLEDLENGLSEGQRVEVKGVYQSDGSILADEIEGEDDDVNQFRELEGEIHLQGIISAMLSAEQFVMNGITVQFDSNELPIEILNSLNPGLRVKVEGSFKNGILIASEIEIEFEIASEQDERGYRAIIQSIDYSTREIEVGYPNVAQTINMYIDTLTELEDENDDETLDFDDLGIGDEIKVESVLIGDRLRVKSLQRIFLEKYTITGVFNSYIPGVSITIDNLPLLLDAGLDNEFSELVSQLIPGESVLMLEDENKDSWFDRIEIE